MGSAGKGLFIAGEPVSIERAFDRLSNYPAKTPAVYDLPGPGEPYVITSDEIRRTRAVSSRISQVEAAWFISTASSAPWMLIDADLRDADPGQSDELYDAMLVLYRHFESRAPRGVGLAKISKVLHLKRPHLYPILDSRLLRYYARAAVKEAALWSHRHNRRMYWAAIRSDLLRSTQGLAQLRTIVAGHPSATVRQLASVSDLRLLDMVTW